MRAISKRRSEGSGQVPSGFSERETRPYRKYRPLPALILIALLGGFSAIVWIKVLNSGSDVDEAVRCSPPATPPAGMSYTVVGHDALDDVDPIPPNKIDVRVLNAGGARGQAAITTEALKQLGFTNVERPRNDAAYKDRTAHCRGQIRYGDNGEAAARTVSLVDSCVELIKDGRKDASVDLVIGSDFGDVLPRRAAVTALERLSTWSEKHQPSSGELSAGKRAPQLSDDLLESARTTSC